MIQVRMRAVPGSGLDVPGQTLTLDELPRIGSTLEWDAAGREVTVVGVNWEVERGPGGVILNVSPAPLVYVE